MKDYASPEFNYESCQPQINGRGVFCFLFFLFLTLGDCNSRKQSPSDLWGLGGTGWVGVTGSSSLRGRARRQGGQGQEAEEGAPPRASLPWGSGGDRGGPTGPQAHGVGVGGPLC